MAREPIVVYRLRCGRRVWSGWKRTRREAFEAGLPHGLTFADNKHISLGPLAWIEMGQWRYAKSKTVPIGRA